MQITEHKLGIPPDYQYHALRRGSIFQRQWHRNRLILIATYFSLNKNDYVCDIGCGSGNVALAFHNKVKNLDACDYNKDCLDFLNSKVKKNGIKNVKTILWDALTPPRKKLINRYNKVIINEVIEHFSSEEIVVVLGNINKILKNGGEVLITTPNCGISPWFILEFLIDRLRLFPKLWEEQHKIRLNKKNLRRICEEEGFKVLNLGTFSLLSPPAIIFGKKTANFIAKTEIYHLKHFGAELFIHLKKIGE